VVGRGSGTTQLVNKVQMSPLYLMGRADTPAEPVCGCHAESASGLRRPLLTISWAKRLGCGADRRICVLFNNYFLGKVSRRSGASP